MGLGPGVSHLAGGQAGSGVSPASPHCSPLPMTSPQLHLLLLCSLSSALKGKPGFCPVSGVLFHDQNNII